MPSKLDIYLRKPDDPGTRRRCVVVAAQRADEWFEEGNLEVYNL